MFPENRLCYNTVTARDTEKQKPQAEFYRKEKITMQVIEKKTTTVDVDCILDHNGNCHCS